MRPGHRPDDDDDVIVFGFPRRRLRELITKFMIRVYYYTI